MSHKTFSKIPPAGEGRREIPCPLCGGDAFAPHWQSPEASWQRCGGCGLILQNPQPLQEAILSRYDDEYFDYETHNEDSFLNLMLLGLKDIDFFGDEAFEGEDKSFLDIGCATGRLGDYLNHRGWQARGVEVCREAAAWGNRHYQVDIFPGTIEEAAFPEGSFRFVHSSHVIEHINRPDLFLQEIWRVLKPGGYYLCVTPNSRSLQAALFGGSWRSAIADHLFLFSTRTLGALVKKTGFRLCSLKTWGGLGAGYAPGWVKKPVDRLIKKSSWGDVMMLVLQKPEAPKN